MTYKELTKQRLKWGLTIANMARLLGVEQSSYENWKTRDKVPNYIAASVEAHKNLSKPILALLMYEREVKRR